jgi:hypothetical protein
MAGRSSPGATDSDPHSASGNLLPALVEYYKRDRRPVENGAGVTVSI